MNKIRSFLVPNWQPIMNATRFYCCNVQSSRLHQFPAVSIGQGKLKYILAKVYIHGEMINAKTVVRAVGNIKYHIDIYQNLRKEANALDLCTQCLGGGILVHDSEEHYIKLYGRSLTMGKANHHDTKDLLSTKYPNYKIDAESGGMEE